MRAAALGNACGARAATVPLTVAAAPLPSSASASPLSIGVAARGGVATSRAGFSAASSRSSREALRSSVVLRAVEGGSLSSVSLGPSASSPSASAAPSASGGGVGGSKVTVVLPLDQVDLTSEVRLKSSGVVLFPWIVIRDLSARSGSGRERLRDPPSCFSDVFFFSARRRRRFARPSRDEFYLIPFCFFSFVNLLSPHRAPPSPAQKNTRALPKKTNKPTQKPQQKTLISLSTL